MVSKIIATDGSEYVVDATGAPHPRAIYKPYDVEVIDNGNGTFSIPSITDAQDLDIAFTRETQACYEYDSARNIWWPWKV